MKKILNVGGGNRNIPEEYKDFEQVLLDINPDVNPDICCDALDIIKLKPNEYDVVYCSHALEHFYKHDVKTVLEGFLHVLKDGGYADIIVPNLRTLVKDLIKNNFDIDDVYYRLEDGAPVTFHDVLYGWDIMMQSGNLFYAHKCGFTPVSIKSKLFSVGFAEMVMSESNSNIFVKAYKGKLK